MKVKYTKIMILYVFLYGHEIWSLTLRKENKGILRVYILELSRRLKKGKGKVVPVL
jgi:hypothetical protein